MLVTLGLGPGLGAGGGAKSMLHGAWPQHHSQTRGTRPCPALPTPGWVTRAELPCRVPLVLTDWLPPPTPYSKGFSHTRQVRSEQPHRKDERRRRGEGGAPFPLTAAPHCRGSQTQCLSAMCSSVGRPRREPEPTLSLLTELQGTYHATRWKLPPRALCPQPAL